MLASLLYYVLAIAGVLVQCQSTSSQTFWPAAVPLAVRSPYLNTWVATLNGTTPSPLNVWPNFWNNRNVMGWSGFVRVDGLTYQWMGMTGNTTNLTSTLITPTRSIFTIQAGAMLLNVTFLSPVEPSDWVRQSLPFSYVYVDATAVDGQSHSVQIYSDISAEWVSGDRNNQAQWNTTQTSTTVYHQVQRTAPAPMQEINDIAEDGTAYYSMATIPGMTWQTGKDADVRGQFANGNGKLLNTQDTAFRGIASDFPVFGIAVDLGSIKATSSPIVWAIGLVRDPAIQYVDSLGRPQERSSYFWTQYPTIGAAIDAYVVDFPNAQRRAIALDQKIVKDAMAVSTNYADLVSLAARQTIGGTEITISKGSDGRWNNTDVKMFMRNMGNGRRVNPVETMYASFPMFLYLNASLGGLLLDPLLQYQNSKLYNNPYAAPDLGTLYPNATGNNLDSHNHGVEDSGDMLIMTLAHARISGDGSLIGNYYNLLKGWADYLVANSLTPTDQITADSQNKPNMTNLAIKGIIGIQAMSEISQVSGMRDDAQRYTDLASSYVKQWQTLAGSSGHLLSSYGQPASWGLIYNLFADKLLQTNLVDPKIYQVQEKFYTDQASTAGKFGLGFDSDAQGQARSDWTMFTTSTFTSNTSRDLLISMVHSRASYNQTTGAFPTLYNIDTGNSSTGQASPAQGAMFAMLSLNLANRTITIPPPPPKRSDSKKNTNVGAIAGGVIGAIVLLALFVVLGVLFWRRRKRHQSIEEPQIMPTSYLPQPSLSQPSIPADVAGKVQPRMGKLQALSGPSSYSGPSASGSHTSQAFSSSHSAGRSSDYDSTVQLRTDVEDLRREMEEIRSHRAYEPPPSYG